jgi:hypothetical protein
VVARMGWRDGDPSVHVSICFEEWLRRAGPRGKSVFCLCTPTVLMTIEKIMAEKGIARIAKGVGLK